MKKRIILIAITLINILALENPSFAYKPIRASGRQKMCFSNQRVLLGAIEMYEMDHTELIDTALPGGDYEDLENRLIKEKYLKTHLEGPEIECSYGFIRINDKEYDVFCKKHGTTETKDIEKPIIPTYNVTDEKPFSEELSRKIQARKREKAIQYFLSNYVFTFPTLTLIFFGIIAASGLGFKTKKK